MDALFELPRASPIRDEAVQTGRAALMHMAFDDRRLVLRVQLARHVGEVVADVVRVRAAARGVQRGRQGEGGAAVWEVRTELVVPVISAPPQVVVGTLGHRARIRTPQVPREREGCGTDAGGLEERSAPDRGLGGHRAPGYR